MGRGISHEKSNLPCQDFAVFEYAKNGNVILALADGASSAQYAREAAIANTGAVVSLFSRITLERFQKHDAERQAEDIITACHRQIKRFAKQVGCTDFKQFSATLLFAVFSKNSVLVGHLGDGAIYGTDDNGKIDFCSDPENIAGVSTRTRFTVSKNAKEYLRLYSIEPKHCRNLVMTSDGAYSMFLGRGGMKAEVTAEELMGYMRDGGIATHTDLADVLNQMAEIPSERMDDWSVLMWDQNQEKTLEVRLEPVSMYQEEVHKHEAAKIRMEREREAREREARDREARAREEQERQAKEREAREKLAREKEAKEKEAREKERLEKERLERKAAQEREEMARAAREAAAKKEAASGKGSSRTIELKDPPVQPKSQQPQYPSQGAAASNSTAVGKESERTTGASNSGMHRPAGSPAQRRPQVVVRYHGGSIKRYGRIVIGDRSFSGEIIRFFKKF